MSNAVATVSVAPFAFNLRTAVMPNRQAFSSPLRDEETLAAIVEQEADEEDVALLGPRLEDHVSAGVGERVRHGINFDCLFDVNTGLAIRTPSRVTAAVP